VYRIVAIAYILATFELEEEQGSILKEWMVRWCATVGNLQPPDGTDFSSFDGVLKGLAAHHRQIRYEDWGELLEDVKSRWGQGRSDCGQLEG
jgi:hypothetical protein